jgi:hypothetical protein
LSKGGKKTDRDASQLVRSSEKIIDKCDFYICQSLFEDESVVDEYRNDYGCSRLVDKRGTGRSVDVVYEFNEKRLTMTQTDFEVTYFDKSAIKM